MIEPARKRPLSNDRTSSGREGRAGSIDGEGTTGKRPFADAVQEAESQRLTTPPAGARLEGLLDDLHSTGDRLKEQPTLGAIREYRRTVQNFMAFVVEHSLQVTRSQSPGFLSKRKQFTLIQVIDRKLQELADHVLSRQADRLDRVQRVDELNGLLVDLTK